MFLLIKLNQKKTNLKVEGFSLILVQNLEIPSVIHLK